jgi:hypothetical protein
MKLSTALLFSLVALAVARAAPISPDKVYSASRAEIIRDAVAAEGQRISVEYASGRSDQSRLKIIEKGEVHVLSTEMLIVLKQALLRDSSDTIASKLCAPSPGIRYILRTKSESITVLVCHSCRMVQVAESGRIAVQRDADDIITELRKVAASFIPAADLTHLP